jgi:SAM-dependent methyltransferase
MGFRGNSTLQDVQAVYSGPEGALWELIMGEQIHIGGLKSSRNLADAAGIQPGSRGVDLCCCTGAGMRFLVHFRGVAEMTGVDATAAVIETGKRRCRGLGMDGKITFVCADACASGLPDAASDFVWGEDAWCYVADKGKLISEAARIVKPGGTIAFTDWIEGENPLKESEAARFLGFMKFPGVETLAGYTRLLDAVGCEVVSAFDTGLFPVCMDAYLGYVENQIAYDVFRTLGFDPRAFEAVAGEMEFIRRLAHERKVAQGLFIARKLGSRNRMESKAATSWYGDN